MVEPTVRRRRGPARDNDSGAIRNETESAEAAREVVPPVSEALRQFVMRSVLMLALWWYMNAPKDSAGGGGGSGAGGATGGKQEQGTFAGLLQTFDDGGPVPSYYGQLLANAWGKGEPFELRCYVGSDVSFEDVRHGGLDPVWVEKGLDYSFADGNYRARNVTLQVPETVATGNSSWFAHIFVARDGLWDGEATEKDVERGVLHRKWDLVKWLKVDPNKQTKSLLDAGEVEDGIGDEKDNTDANENRYEQVWKPTMPVIIAMHNGPVKLADMPPTVAQEFRVAVKEKQYYPPMLVHDFWMVRDSLRPMNETVAQVTIEMSFAPMSTFKWTVFKQFDAIWDKQKKFGSMREGETDELKRMFVETNPVLLGTTMVVSLAHTVLEALAFKNDISHWKEIKSMEGISVRTMMWKIGMEFIVFLYLWDNETSWMITIGNGIGVAIAIWKLGKAIKVKSFGKRKILRFIPWFEIEDRASYSKETKEYDEQAMRYLGYALYPLVIVYALYSLKYDKHKSWYSWVINSLVGAVYAFGFIMMFPQIFINYKLKSVAHMPMKAMMYKTLNTVIDDLFSFIIKMPWLHRLACFRDDAVFLVLLYQRFIYRVDKSRVNEFGQQFDAQGEETIVTPATPATPTTPATPASPTVSSSSTMSERKDTANESAPKPAALKKEE